MQPGAQKTPTTYERIRSIMATLALIIIVVAFGLFALLAAAIRDGSDFDEPKGPYK